MPSRSTVSIWPETSPRRLLQALTVFAALGLGVPAVSESRSRDRDGDGLSNRVELRHTHTSPRRADTDSDGLGDAVEVRRTHTNPRRADTDGDGLRDRVEVRRSNTNPRRADTDRDGLSDGFEVRKSHTKPLRIDTDADGSTDGLEVLLRTDPREPPGQKKKLVPPPPSDTTAPETAIVSGPSGTVTDSSASFAFTSSEVGSTFQCRQDGGVWGACSSPKAYFAVANGSHSFDVRATDPAGNTDSSPASQSWNVDVPPPPPPSDTTPPETSISSGPSGTVATSAASFGFSSSESASTFSCRVDAGSWSSCSSPKAYADLANGSHTFDVRATDGAGNTDASPASRTWTVNVPPADTTAPNTTIDSGPSGTVASGSASFGFSSSEAGSSFQCRLDAGTWGSCTSPKAYSSLTNGSHTFDVRATDGAGNTDASPASRTWTVDVSPPAGGVIRVAPGGDISAAYNQAQSGDVIELACGLHGRSRSLPFEDRPGSWTTPAGTKRVTVRSETPQCAKLRQLINQADNITFDGLDLDAQGTQTNWAVFESGGRQNVTLKNSRVGNVVDEKGAMLGGPSGTGTASTNLVIDNVVFHDVRQVTAGVHNECVYSQAPGLRIRNSTFTNCATMDLFVKRGDWWGQQPYGDITLENNVFGHSRNGSGWHYYGLYWTNDAFENVRVVNNTFENSLILGSVGSGPYSGVWANNIGGGWSCLAGVTYRNNVGKVCDASDKAVSPVSSCGPPACSSLITAPYKWANPAAEDFHLLAGSPAIDAGSAQYAPPLDRDGKPRNGAPDAGAYEF
jgi:Bacterial TSP3 repeat